MARTCGAFVVLAALATPTDARAQVARDTLAVGERYFHDAAQHYLAEDVATARERVEAGLAREPHHPKLLALRRMLEEPGASPEPDSGRSGQDGAPQQQDDASGTSGQDGQQGEQEGPSSGDAGSSDSGQSQDEETPGQRDASDAQDGPSGERRDAQPNEASASERPARSSGSGQRAGDRPTEPMSRAQAERILRALEGQEKQLLREVQKQAPRPEAVEKDW